MTNSSIHCILCQPDYVNKTRLFHDILRGGGAYKYFSRETLNQLKLVGGHHGHLHMDDGHSLSIPKLLHIVCTSPAFSSPLLESWDHLMMAIICRITNINFKQGDASWSQATLPVNSGGLGLRSASNLAPSAFLASADGVLDLTRQLLPAHLSAASHSDRNLALSTWQDALPVNTPLPTATHWQKTWNQPVVHHLFDSLLAHCTD